jgi:hypothetical protein
MTDPDKKEALELMIQAFQAASQSFSAITFTESEEKKLPFAEQLVKGAGVIYKYLHG